MKPITLWTVRFVGNVTKKLFLKEDSKIEVVGLTRTQIRCLSSLQSPAVSCLKYFCQHCAEKSCIQPLCLRLFYFLLKLGACHRFRVQLFRVQNIFVNTALRKRVFSICVSGYFANKRHFDYLFNCFPVCVKPVFEDFSTESLPLFPLIPSLFLMYHKRLSVLA